MVPDIPGVRHGYDRRVDVNLGAQSALDRILAGQERHNREDYYRYLFSHNTPLLLRTKAKTKDAMIFVVEKIYNNPMIIIIILQKKSRGNIQK
jgi:hypothetical protein